MGLPEVVYEVSSKPSGDAAGWQSTSVRWLKEKHPEYLMGCKAKSFKDKLAFALTRMSWLRAEAMEGFIDKLDMAKGAKSTGGTFAAVYKELIEGRVEVWSPSLHKQMAEFIAAGGYRTADHDHILDSHASALETGTKAWEARRSTKEVKEMLGGLDKAGAFSGRTMDGMIMDELGDIEMEEVESSLKPKSQLSPDHELEEVLAEEARKQDPRYGSW